MTDNEATRTMESAQAASEMRAQVDDAITDDEAAEIEREERARA